MLSTSSSPPADLHFQAMQNASSEAEGARTGKGSVERSLQSDNNNILKVHWQEQVRDVGDQCERQTPPLAEKDVAFQECLENDKKFNFQYRDG